VRRSVDTLSWTLFFEKKPGSGKTSNKNAVDLRIMYICESARSSNMWNVFCWMQSLADQVGTWILGCEFLSFQVTISVNKIEWDNFLFEVTSCSADEERVPCDQCTYANIPMASACDACGKSFAEPAVHPRPVAASTSKSSRPTTFFADEEEARNAPLFRVNRIAQLSAHANRFSITLPEIATVVW
jgi:hypothetical protein